MSIENLEHSLKEVREQLKNHELYAQLDSVEDIRTFMESHVYAVWDFMSLLKALQRELTCTDLPWKPASDTTVARFINEIVLEEESDFNEEGVAKSHFEMYLDAMEEVNANTSKVNDVIGSFGNLEEIAVQINNADLNLAEKNFLSFTFEVINTQKPHIIAAAFTFGREELIPDMFLGIIEQSGKKGPEQYPKLSYYLKRHIELDGDEHGPMAVKMMKMLCGQDEQKWTDVAEYSQRALEHRVALWESITKKLRENKGNLIEAL
ncbi:DUF3050 domain-containing protein [Flagellimonas sp.]|uniref:DUF3050 domain-containing protein n=1 Tax=Flagellimonas sp. TaxID=2058762 RepID=UPI003BAA30B5